MVERQTCDQKVVGSSLGRARDVKTLDKFLTHMCPCGMAEIAGVDIAGVDNDGVNRRGGHCRSGQ